MTIMTTDVCMTQQQIFVMLEDVTASAVATEPGPAEATIRARAVGDVTRRINGATYVQYDWIDPKFAAPGDPVYQIMRGNATTTVTSIPGFDFDDLTDPGYGPQAGVWTDIDTTNSFWGYETDGVSEFSVYFTVSIRQGGGSPGPVIDTATWTLSIDENAASGGGGGGGGCFTSDMLVLMADGREKRIADIFVGEAVMSLNTETGKLEASRVNDIMVPRLRDIYEIHLSNGKVIKTSSDHPFRTVSGKWAAIDPTVKTTIADTYIKEGLLLHGAEEHARVTKIVQTGRKETVYHLAHVGMRNFFVEGFCVHNKQIVQQF